MVGRVEGVIRLMEGRAISQALQAIARLKASSATAGPAGAAGAAATARATAGVAKAPGVAATGAAAAGALKVDFDGLVVALSRRGAVGHIVETFFAAEIAQSLAALGRLGVPADDDLVEALSVRAATEGIFKGTDARNLVELVQGLATLGVTPAKWAPALDQIAQAVTVQAQLYSLNQDDVADLLEAYGKVGYRSEWLLVRSAARIMTPVFLARIAPRHVAKIVTALATAHFRDTALLDTLSANLLRLNDRMVITPDQASAVVQGYLSLGLADAKLLRVLAPICEQAQDEEEEAGEGGSSEGEDDDDVAMGT